MNKKSNTNFDINDKGFVIFKKRNFQYKGDKFTWARKTENKLVFKKASRGLLSDDFEIELIEFLKQFDLDYENVASGETIEINI